MVFNIRNSFENDGWSDRMAASSFGTQLLDFTHGMWAWEGGGRVSGFGYTDKGSTGKFPQPEMILNNKKNPSKYQQHSVNPFSGHAFTKPWYPQRQQAWAVRGSRTDPLASRAVHLLARPRLLPHFAGMPPGCLATVSVMSDPETTDARLAVKFRHERL